MRTASSTGFEGNTKKAMPRYKLLITYDGTAYQGWQKQPEGKSIQGTLENTVFHLFGKRAEVVGSGRTDAGVHALGQVAHVDLSLPLQTNDLRAALNGRLPQDIRIKGVEIVSDTFHARYSAVKRAYAYLIRHGMDLSPFFRNSALQIPSPLDLERMNQAAATLVGKHDFSAFRAAGGGHTLPVRTVFTSEIVALSENLFCYLIVADAFLRKMVRGIAGTLLEIGTGKSEPSLMTRLLTEKDRSLMGTLAPPQGLYLAAVFYPEPEEEVNRDG